MKLGFLLLMLTGSFAQASEVRYFCQNQSGDESLQLRLSRHSAWLSHIRFANYFPMDPSAAERLYSVKTDELIRDLMVPTAMILNQVVAGDVEYSTQDTQSGIVQEYTYHCSK